MITQVGGVVRDWYRDVRPEPVVEVFTRASHITADGPLEIVTATSVVGESTDDAYDRAAAWLARQTSVAS